jgi:hypothetical protein
MSSGFYTRRKVKIISGFTSFLFFKNVGGTKTYSDIFCLAKIKTPTESVEVIFLFFQGTQNIKQNMLLAWEPIFKGGT